MDTVKSRITAAIWPWGTQTREQMETAAAAISKIGYEKFESVKNAIYAYDLDVKAYKEVLDRYNLQPVSFYFHLGSIGNEVYVFDTLDKELEFISQLGVERICLQGTYSRPEVMDDAALDFQLNLVARFAEKTKEFGIMTNVHPHHNTWIMYEKEIDYILQNIGSDLAQFAPDTAHLVRGECDPVAVIKKYIDRVNFTHLKDTSGGKLKSSGLAKEGMEVYANFCELGKGKVDFRSIFDMLKAHNYDGPLCEELDRAPVSNEESALNNFNFILKNY